MARQFLAGRHGVRTTLVILGIVLITYFGIFGSPWAEVGATPAGQTVTVPTSTVPTVEPTITPTPTNTPTITPTPTPTNTPIVVAPPSQVDVDVVVNPSTSVAVDAAGNTITVNPGQAKATKDSSGEIKIELPVQLGTGQSLDTFEDTTSGVKVETNTVTGQVEVSIPVKDETGVTQAKIVAKLENAPEGTGNTAEAVVAELVLETEPQTVDLSESDPDVGDVEVQIDATLVDIPENASISMNVSKELSSDAQVGFELAATNAGTEIKDIAYALEVKKTGLTDQAVVSESTIQMCVGRAWYDRNGGDAAADGGLFTVFRRDESGRRETLQTTITSTSATQVCFEALSPNGLSIFALVALDEPLQPTPTPVPPLEGQSRLEVSPAVRAIINSTDGRVNVDVPVGGVPTLLDVQITDLSRSDVPPVSGVDALQLTGPQFRVEVLAGGTPLDPFTFTKSVSINVTYTDADIGGVDTGEAQLRLVRWSPVIAQWVNVGGGIDPITKTLTALTRRPGLYSLAAPLPPPTPTPEDGATPQATSTPDTPSVGDISPSTGLLLAVVLLGFLLVTTGVYYFRTPRKEEQA